MAQLNPAAQAMIKQLSTVPEVRYLLGDRVVRSEIYKALLEVSIPLPIITDDPHTISDCRRAVTDAGFVVKKFVPLPEPVLSDHPTPSVSFGPYTQQGLMLRSFVNAQAAGLTDDVAAEQAGLGKGVAASPWKRASELRAAGMIEYLEDEHSETVYRTGMRGASAAVSVATNYGRMYYEEIAA